MLTTGNTAPDFTLPRDGDQTVTLSALRPGKVVIYFYPKDDTPGCTTEACSFRDNYVALSESGLVVLGVSKDAPKSHKKFAEKYEITFPLLADTDGVMCEAYGVWRKKKFMGREYMGIERMSFLIDEKGNLAKIYESVKPKDHVSEVADDIK